MHQKYAKSHIKGVQKTCQEGEKKPTPFLVCLYTSQDFAQTQKKKCAVTRR